MPIYLLSVDDERCYRFYFRRGALPPKCLTTTFGDEMIFTRLRGCVMIWPGMLRFRRARLRHISSARLSPLPISLISYSHQARIMAMPAGD